MRGTSYAVAYVGNARGDEHRDDERDGQRRRRPKRISLCRAHRTGGYAQQRTRLVSESATPWRRAASKLMSGVLLNVACRRRCLWARLMVPWRMTRVAVGAVDDR